MFGLNKIDVKLRFIDKYIVRGSIKLHPVI